MRKQTRKEWIQSGVLAACLVLAVSVMGISASLSADNAVQPAPTLVPPTLVPTQDAGVNDALLSESALARVQQDGKVRVGLYYNEPPFSELNIRNEVVGYDADIAKSMAEAWGVTFEPVQVTEQTALDMLKNGTVDMLASSQVHRRSLDFEVEFSQTYYMGSQSMLVRQDDGAAGLADMANRKVGYVLGSTSSDAIALWQQRTGISIQVHQYLTLDQAYNALLNSEVDGIVDSRVHLTRIIPQPGMGKILDEPVTPEPYAIVVRRQDVNWRNLINKTLQYLVRKGRMQEIQQTYFPNSKYPINLVPVWGGVTDDAPKPDQFPADITYPAQYAVPRIQSSGVVRVAGVADLPPDATESQRRLDAFNHAIIEAVAARWGVQVQYIPNSADNAIDLIASGQADLAVGVTLDWSLTDKVDLTTPYLLHGDRLMTKKDSDYQTFNDLRGRWVAIFASEPGSEDTVNALAESVRSPVHIFTINHDDNVADALLNTSSADVAFGDSLKLIPQVQANPDQLELSTRGNNPDPWYSRIYIGMAVPRNDVDFRLLVEYTLQELARSGAWQVLLNPVMLPEDVPPFDIWPGSSDYLGFKLG
jgi:polar amino acid transport system substrate-binding protein